MNHSDIVRCASESHRFFLRVVERLIDPLNVAKILVVGAMRLTAAHENLNQRRMRALRSVLELLHCLFHSVIQESDGHRPVSLLLAQGRDPPSIRYVVGQLDNPYFAREHAITFLIVSIQRNGNTRSV